MESIYRADVQIDGEVEYELEYQNLKDLFAEFDSPVSWSIDGCMYYDVVSVEYMRSEGNLEIYLVIVE